jgi:hypothetical protein
VVVDDQRIGGYLSLSVEQIDSLEAPERVRKGMGNYPIPVVILARLAVSMVDQGCGLGVGLRQDAILRTLVVADQAGVRALLTHLIDEAAARFCLRFGFEESPAREQQLILLLKGGAPPDRANFHKCGRGQVRRINREGKQTRG